MDRLKLSDWAELDLRVKNWLGTLDRHQPASSALPGRLALQPCEMLHMDGRTVKEGGSTPLGCNVSGQIRVPQLPGVVLRNQHQMLYYWGTVGLIQDADDSSRKLRRWHYYYKSRLDEEKCVA